VPDDPDVARRVPGLGGSIDGCCGQARTTYKGRLAFSTRGFDRDRRPPVDANRDDGAALKLVFLDQTAVSMALPSIGRELDATHAELAWVVNAFLLTLAAVDGSLGDLAGRSRVLVGGVVLSGLASFVCGLAPSEGWLIAARRSREPKRRR
jgi:hypothetical protein